MKRLFIYPYLFLCALAFYPSTVLIWLFEPKEMRQAGYMDIKSLLKQLKSEL